MVVFIAIIEILIPLFLLLSVASQRPDSLVSLALNSLAMGSALFVLWLLMPWDFTSVYWRQLIPIAFIAAVWVAYRRINTAAEKPGPVKVWLANAIALILLVGMGALAWQALKGYPAPEGAIALQSPFDGGRFVVGHGGNSPWINGHARVKPQNHALDIVGLSPWGNRKDPRGASNELERYAIWGASVVAPCAGRVLVTVDGLEDLPPGIQDRNNLAGNHVVIECQGAEVLLAHLRRGSVRVSTGQMLELGTEVGQVGNSGNTSEPHLHMHAERGGARGVILKGEPVPMLIDGKYLVRGDVF